jgi:F0F1-type ATP synthase assembly protein I
MTQRPRVPIPGLEPESEDRRQSRSFTRFAGVGLQFALSVVLFSYAGQWVDRKFETTPWGVIVGVFVGAGAAFYSMYHRLMADLRREEEARKG